MTLTGRTGTAVVAAAIVSLCLNLALAGVLIGGRWHDGPFHHDGPFWKDLPEEARPIVKDVFSSHKTDFDAHRKDVEAARQKVADLLKADPIDKDQLNQALAELSQQTQAMQQFGQQVMVEIAEKLPPDLRSEMADRWAKDRFRKPPAEP
ncbi:MAG TPA: periplasmic heavy metal sensor [Dongiaceae bacterium]|jgi:Spy/CpxP family protein refolding chaperone